MTYLASKDSRSSPSRSPASIPDARSQPVHIQAATDSTGDHRIFTDFVLREQIYGTGWDGTMVFSASLDGHYAIKTEKSPAFLRFGGSLGSTLAPRTRVRPLNARPILSGQIFWLRFRPCAHRL